MISSETPSKPLKALHFLGVAGAGGTELTVYELIRRSDPSLLRQDVLVLAESGPMTDKFARLGARVTHLRWDERLNKAGILLDARRELAKGDYDLVIAYGLRANIISRLAAAGLRVKAAGGLRAICSSDAPSRLHDLLDRATFPLSAGYIANSETAVERYAGIGFPRRKLHIVYNGVDTERFTPGDREEKDAARSSLGIDRGEFAVVSVANLRPVKNHSLQLRALSLLREEKIAAALLLVGEGPMENAILKEADEIGVAGAVRLLGRRDDVPQILAASDVFLLSSKWEGIPNSLLEAMAAGLPVVATGVGGIGEAVGDGGEGFIVPPGDAGAMAERLARLARDPELRKTMGARGRARAVERFSMEKMLEGFYECCRAIVSSSGKAD